MHRYEVVQALANPVHATLAAVVGQLEAGQTWKSLQGLEVDATLAGHLRRYSLVMQHALQRVQQFDAANAKDGGAANQGKAGPGAGLQWLAQTFLQKVSAAWCVCGVRDVCVLCMPIHARAQRFVRTADETHPCMTMQEHQSSITAPSTTASCRCSHP
jgi:hypothetical protein